MRSEAEKLCGTSEPPAAWRRLTAGPLSADLENGQVRYIRVSGVEVLRAISFLARDRYWGTFPAEISGLEVIEDPERFTVRYAARCAPDEGDLRYEVEITGEAPGRLAFHARGAPVGEFVTNRTGFVVLHPLDGIAGAELELDHVGGHAETVRLPELISPHEPAQNLFAITHRAEGLAVRVEMTGDAYDMEDQRNWTDASFKTYIRPLSKPKPYVMAAGVPFEQSVTVSVTGEVARPASAAPKRGLQVGDPVGSLPRMGLMLEAADATAAIERARHFRWAQHVIGRPDRPEDVAAIASFARQIEAGLEIQFAIPGEDPAAELLPWVSAGADADDVLVTPWRLWPLRPASAVAGDASLAAIAKAARDAFPNSRIGGGVLTGFTELNRNRPPSELVDYVAHATTAIVHAADDRSVVETLDTLPHVFRSARALAPGKPYRVGPATIGMALNPDGPPRHTDGPRATMVRNDPRWCGLFGAAWVLGYAATLPPFAIESFAPGAVAGDLGILDAEGLRPVYHVVRALALTAGAEACALSGLPQGCAGFAAGGTLWVANLTPVGVTLDLASPADATILDLTSIEAAARDEAFFDLPQQGASAQLVLGAYGVGRIWP